jgi:NADH-quinone oxidoreductase subunit L
MDPKALLAIVLFPLVGAILNGLLGRAGKEWAASRAVVHSVACGSVAASFAFAVWSFTQLIGMHHAAEGQNVSISYTAYEWFSINVAGKNVPVQVRFVMDTLSGVMTLVVTGIGLLIHIYSTGYMSEEPSYGRFFSYLNLFTASMLILILGSNMPLMFVGWEGVGLCSYLLIGFWWENPAYAAAGRKAFVANRIGDFGVVLGMLVLVASVGSFEFAAINARAGALTQPLVLSGMTFGTLSIATAATLCLFLGCAGKSAQIPLYVWLPDAMAGPTPVSALIHAATMVTSGLYLMCRLSPLFAVAPTSMAVIAVTGAATALLAATIGCVQNDIKKVLAYSTVSQLGFMFAAAGCGAFAASFFHVYTHAFFKACLFLCAGSVMHAVGAHGDADIRRLGGLRKFLPITHWTFLVSCLAIAGVPLFSGFFSKDEILVGALSVGEYFPEGLGQIVFGMLVAAATMTAFYMFRLYFLTFAGEYRGGPEHHGEAEHHGDDEHAHGDPHESPASMTIPLVVLGLGAIVAGYVWIGALSLVDLQFQPWVDWLEPALGKIGEEHDSNANVITAMLAGTLAAAFGIGLAYSWYGRPGVETPKLLAERFAGLHRLVFDKWRIDELYDATILALSRALALISAAFDNVVVDGLLAKATVAIVQGLSFLFTRLQNGLMQSYAAVMVAGLLLVLGFFTMPHVAIDVPTPPSGDTVQLEGQPGLGYQFRWSYASKGHFDTEWETEAKASHTYTDAEMQPGAVIVLEPATYAAGLRHKPLALGERYVLDPGDLGAAWQSEPGKDTPPEVTATKDGLLVQANGARVRQDGKAPSDGKLVLKRGQHVDIGQARLSVVGLARATLRVRNAFGVERQDSLELELPAVKERPAVEVLGMAEKRP